MDCLTPIRVVVATRAKRDAFFAETATGRSSGLYSLPHVELRLHAENARGLPEIYNEEIEACRDEATVLVFLHDDVFLCDFWWTAQVAAALGSFGLVGICGNRRRVPRQPSWAFVDAAGTWDAPENLSGVIGHGEDAPPRRIDVFGPSCVPVKLLDGVMMAARGETFHKTGIRFDQQFPFHFYDLDLCRQFDAKGVAMGTWPISVVHQSRGGYAANGWIEGYVKYLQKWGE